MMAMNNKRVPLSGNLRWRWFRRFTEASFPRISIELLRCFVRARRLEVLLRGFSLFPFGVNRRRVRRNRLPRIAILDEPQRAALAMAATLRGS